MTYAVPEPVGGGGETDTAGADWQREDLADDDPGGWTPGGGKEGDVDADEGDHGLDSGLVVLAWSASSDTDDTDDELGDDHASGTEDQNATTAETLNDPEGQWGAADVDEGGDERDQERVVDRAEGLEEDGTEVEDEVDTGELLHHLHEDTEKSAADVGGTAGDGTREAVGPATNVRGLWDDLLLILVVRDDLGKLILDVVGLDWLATNGSKSLGGLLELAVLDKVTWGLWEEEETGGEDDSPEELDGDWDSVGSGIIAVLCGVDDAVGEEDTDGDAELVAGDQSTTDLLWRDLGHVEDDDGGDETDTGTGDQTTDDHDCEGGGSGLEDTSDGEDGAAQDDGQAATDEVGNITSGDGTKESAGGQDGGHEGLVRGWDDELLLVGLVLGGGDVGESILRIFETGVETDEVWHSQDTTHPSGIITKEDTTEGGEGTHEVCLDGHGGLDTRGIGGALDDQSACHCC